MTYGSNLIFYGNEKSMGSSETTSFTNFGISRTIIEEKMQPKYETDKEIITADGVYDVVTLASRFGGGDSVARWRHRSLMPSRVTSGKQQRQSYWAIGVAIHRAPLPLLITKKT